MVEVSIKYPGDLRCEAVHGPSSAHIATDAPVDNHGRGGAFSPTDLCATSLGVCMMTVMGIQARARGVDLAGTKVVLRKMMSDSPPRRIARIEAAFDFPACPAPADREALEAAARNCPVALSLHPEIEQVIAFRWPA